MFLEQRFGSLDSFFRQQHRFGFALRIVDVAALIQAIQNFPTVAFPGSESRLVFERGEIQQCQRNLINSQFVYVHHNPISSWKDSIATLSQWENPCYLPQATTLFEDRRFRGEKRY